jgi:hypothetical protein
VLLNLGARPNQQPQQTRSGNTHTTRLLAAQTGQAVFETDQTASVGLSLTQAGETGQTDFVQKLSKEPKHLKSLSTSEQKKP